MHDTKAFSTSYFLRYFGKSKKKHELTVHGLEDDPVFNEYVSSSSYPTKASETERDDMYNYQCSLLDQGLLYMDFIECIAEGDGNRIIRCWKFLMLHFFAENKSKYAIEVLYLLIQQNCLLSQREAYRQRWNRSTNKNGGAGNNVSLDLDLDLEHDNNYLKEALKKLGPNVAQSAVSRCGKILKFARKKVEDINRECAVMKRTVKHFIKSARKDLEKLVHHLIEKEALTLHPGRHYRYFANIALHTLNKNALSGLCKWIKNHKKGIITGRKAQ